jgi:hypothetical protein
MSSLVCVVEGHGEVQAVPVLVRRVRDLVLPGFAVYVPPGIRAGREQLIRGGGIERYVQLAASKIQGPGAILVLLDADDDCPKDLAPQLLVRAQAARSDMPMAVVLAVREYECWFLAAAESLRGHRGMPTDLESPENSEAVRGAKEWLRDRTPKERMYSPAADQAALTQSMDFNQARSRSDSFDKCYREIVRLLNALQPPPGPPPQPSENQP